ncbi:PREDICTED: uncharacterized protein LOC109169920 [Ipomoea nil]|uniref:uncharacterized protein LOC109169920 n=1 Tax=Ipomoea nil TaxID=35883 RepID=UPI000901E70F|nr:PREDICTED: uncharacterized protein LOC109169920 [Ipomoea nil]
MFHSSDEDRSVLPPYYYYVSNSKEMINGTSLIPRFGSGNLGPVLQPAGGRFRHLSLPPCLPLNQSLPPNYLPPLLPLPLSKPQTGSLSGPLTTNTKTCRSDPRKKSKKKLKQPSCSRNPGGKQETALKSDNTKVLLGLSKNQLPSNKVSHNANVISTTSGDGCVKEIDEQYDVVIGLDDKFSTRRDRDRAVFTLSPPPSSLPFPTFSLRPKLRRSAPPAGNPDQQRN